MSSPIDVRVRERRHRVIPADDLWRELRQAVRTLRKTPGFAVVAIFTLALAVSANSAIFSVVYAVLLKPLPIENAGDLVVFWGTDPSERRPVVELSYRNIQEWNRASGSFAGIAAMGSSTWTAVMEGPAEPSRVRTAGVTASFFDTLGAGPLLGRTFRADDDVPNAAGVVVVNYGAWVRRFGSDPRVLGTTLTLDQRLYTIVGVMPRGFDVPRNAEFWIPVVPILAASSAKWGGDALTDVGVLFGVGRLRRGVTPIVAAQELGSLLNRPSAVASPRFGSGVTVTPLLEHLIGPVWKALWLLFAAVVALLLIACANVSALMLTQATLRRRKQAMQVALGASPLTLARICIFETATVSIAGGVIGLIAARWLAAAIMALAPDDVPRIDEVSINLPVALFTYGAVVVSALFCAIGPIRQATASDLLDALRDGGQMTAGKRGQRARAGLLMIQISLAIVLLVSAGLILKSFVNVRTIDLGFTPQNVLTLSVRPTAAQSAANEWFGVLIARIAGLPHVQAAGGVFLPPLALGPIGQDTQVLLENQPDTPVMRRRNPTLNYQVATRGYFDAMRIPLLSGRLFDSGDDRRAPRVAIVSATAARRLWPGENPLGKRLAMPAFRPGANRDEWRTVVGVVADVRYRSVDTVWPDVYDPAEQASSTTDHLVIRTNGNPLDVVADVRAVVRALDAHAIVDGVTTMDGVITRATAPWRLGAWMFTLFAVMACALAAVGLFSLVSLDVAARRRDFAVRLALGAARTDIARLVLAFAARQISVGIPLGLLIAVVATGAFRGLLFGVTPLDSGTYAAVVLLVIGVVALASYLPARRAAAVDPLTLLRRE